MYWTSRDFSTEGTGISVVLWVVRLVWGKIKAHYDDTWVNCSTGGSGGATSCYYRGLERYRTHVPRVCEVNSCRFRIRWGPLFDDSILVYTQEVGCCHLLW